MALFARLMVLMVIAALVAVPAAMAQTKPKTAKGHLRLQGGQWNASKDIKAAQQIPEDTEQLNLAQIPSTPPRGQIRVQGRPLAEPEEPLPVPPGLSVDLRQQMRKFIQSISTFSRRYHQNFAVVTRGGLELLIKRDPVEETRYSPARTYMRSIDGVLLEGLYYGQKVFGEPTSTVSQSRKLRLADIGKKYGLKVFVVDFSTDHRSIEDAFNRNKAKGYVSTTAHAPIIELNSFPPHPARPFNESPHSIASVKDVMTFGFITNSQTFGRADVFALKMKETNYDLLIVDVMHGRKPLNKRAVETLKFKKIGGRRLVFATIDIGAASSHRHYWKQTWREGSPNWIKDPVRDAPDSHYVEFWRPEWQRIISGDTKSYVYGIIALGFDGAILEGIEQAYRFFEGGGEEEEEQTPTAAAPAAPRQAPAAPAAPAPPQ